MESKPPSQLDIKKVVFSQIGLDDCVILFVALDLETPNVYYQLAKLRDTNRITIQVKVLHHLASIELTVVKIEISIRDKCYTTYNQHLIDERLTLKYF
jgi:hypothetical protein